MSGGDSSDLSNEGEPQATSSSALRDGSGKEDEDVQPWPAACQESEFKATASRCISF